MVTREYQGLRSQEEIKRACFNQKISSFPATINRKGCKNASDKQKKV